MQDQNWKLQEEDHGSQDQDCKKCPRGASRPRPKDKITGKYHSLQVSHHSAINN